jgi:predicted Zn-dependent peptidase
MERLNLISNHLDNLIKYYDISSNKVKKDINKILLKIHKEKPLTQKEVERIKQYSFRYRMIIESNHTNTTARLDRIYRKPLTSPNNDIV